MRRFCIVLGGIFIAASLWAALLPSHPAAAQTTPLKIGLVTDIGAVDDRSFNQSAWEGVKTAADALGAEYDFIETTDPNDYANNLALFAEQGYSLIVTTGAAIGEAVAKAAQKFPQVHFVAVDVNMEDVLRRLDLTVAQVPNVTGLIFPEDKAGFLSGALAAYMTRSGVIAAVLPTDQIQPVVNFADGFKAGAVYIKPDVRILATYHPGGLTIAFEDPAWGAQTAAQAIDQGADVIFSGGGKTGNGGLQEVAKRTTPEKPLYCIGVDTDQWFTVPEAQPCLITSGMKLITDGVDALVRQFAGSVIKRGNFVGDVGLAPFHDFETVVPPTVVAALAKIEADLRSGALRTDGTRLVIATPEATVEAAPGR